MVYTLIRKSFFGEWSLNPCQLQGKNPLYRKISPEEDRTRDAVDSEPKHYQRAIPAPIMSMKDTCTNDADDDDENNGGGDDNNNNSNNNIDCDTKDAGDGYEDENKDNDNNNN